MEILNILDKEKVKELLRNKELKNQEDVLDLNKQLFKELMETILGAELDNHLGYEKHQPKHKLTDNSRNGSSQKRVKAGELGEATLEIPRDGNGDF